MISFKKKKNAETMLCLVSQTYEKDHTILNHNPDLISTGFCKGKLELDLFSVFGLVKA